MSKVRSKSTPPSLEGVAASKDLLGFLNNRQFGTILADPPWQFQNRTGKVAPEHKRLSRYGTLHLEDIKALPVVKAAAPATAILTNERRSMIESPAAEKYCSGFARVSRDAETPTSTVCMLITRVIIGKRFCRRGISRLLQCRSFRLGY